MIDFISCVLIIFSVISLIALFTVFIFFGGSKK